LEPKICNWLPLLRVREKTVITVIHGWPCFYADAQEDDAFTYPEGLFLVENSSENSVVVM
jgi:hypothetical protein